MLFAADLRTFSERLTTKIEIEEPEPSVKKEEEDGENGQIVQVKTETTIKTEEIETGKKRVLLVDEVVQTQRKRRRR